MARRPARVCLQCGQITSRPAQSGLCPECQAEYEEGRPARAIYDSPRWRAYRRRVTAAWVRRNGWWCPGWQRPGHPSRDLTVDHPVALSTGGAAYPENPGVLCRACNGRKGASSTPATGAIT